MSSNIVTPETDPDHSVVGRFWGGYKRGVESSVTIYLCDSYDPKLGFWMTDVFDSAIRTNISERAINRTFWEADRRADHYYIRQWGCKIAFDGTQFPKFGEPGWKPTETSGSAISSCD